MTPLELLRICAWKSAKGLALLTVNSESEIVNVTARALEVLQPYADAQSPEGGDEFWDVTSRAIGEAGAGGLRSLKGIGLPMASAILCVLNPRVWPVIDRWALWALTDYPRQEMSRVGRLSRRFDTYRDTYHPALVQALTRYPGETIHEVDKRAQACGMKWERL